MPQYDLNGTQHIDITEILNSDSWEQAREIINNNFASMSQMADMSFVDFITKKVAEYINSGNVAVNNVGKPGKSGLNILDDTVKKQVVSQGAEFISFNKFGRTIYLSIHLLDSYSGSQFLVPDKYAPIVGANVLETKILNTEAGSLTYNSETKIITKSGNFSGDHIVTYLSEFTSVETGSGYQEVLDEKEDKSNKVSAITEGNKTSEDYYASTKAVDERITERIATKADLENGIVPSSQLPSYVDDVIMGVYVDETTFTKNGIELELEQDKIYVDTSVNPNKQYRFTGTVLIPITNTIAFALQSEAEQISPTENSKIATLLRVFQGFVYWIENSPLESLGNRTVSESIGRLEVLNTARIPMRIDMDLTQLEYDEIKTFDNQEENTLLFRYDEQDNKIYPDSPLEDAVVFDNNGNILSGWTDINTNQLKLRMVSKLIDYKGLKDVSDSITYSRVFLYNGNSPKRIVNVGTQYISYGRKVSNDEYKQYGQNIDNVLLSAIQYPYGQRAFFNDPDTGDLMYIDWLDSSVLQGGNYTIYTVTPVSKVTGYSVLLDSQNVIKRRLGTAGGAYISVGVQPPSNGSFFVGEDTDGYMYFMAFNTNITFRYNPQILQLEILPTPPVRIVTNNELYLVNSQLENGFVVVGNNTSDGNYAVWYFNYSDLSWTKLSPDVGAQSFVRSSNIGNLVLTYSKTNAGNINIRIFDLSVSSTETVFEKNYTTNLTDFHTNTSFINYIGVKGTEFWVTIGKSGTNTTHFVIIDSYNLDENLYSYDLNAQGITANIGEGHCGFMFDEKSETDCFLVHFTTSLTNFYVANFNDLKAGAHIDSAPVFSSSNPSLFYPEISIIQSYSCLSYNIGTKQYVRSLGKWEELLKFVYSESEIDLMFSLQNDKLKLIQKSTVVNANQSQLITDNYGNNHFDYYRTVGQRHTDGEKLFAGVEDGTVIHIGHIAITAFDKNTKTEYTVLTPDSQDGSGVIDFEEDDNFVYIRTAGSQKIWAVSKRLSDWINDDWYTLLGRYSGNCIPFYRNIDMQTGISELRILLQGATLADYTINAYINGILVDKSSEFYQPKANFTPIAYYSQNDNFEVYVCVSTIDLINNNDSFNIHWYVRDKLNHSSISETQNYTLGDNSYKEIHVISDVSGEVGVFNKRLYKFDFYGDVMTFHNGEEFVFVKFSPMRDKYLSSSTDEMYINDNFYGVGLPNSGGEDLTNDGKIADFYIKNDIIWIATTKGLFLIDFRGNPNSVYGSDNNFDTFDIRPVDCGFGYNYNQNSDLFNIPYITFINNIGYIPFSKTTVDGNNESANNVRTLLNPTKEEDSEGVIYYRTNNGNDSRLYSISNLAVRNGWIYGMGGNYNFGSTPEFNGQWDCSNFSANFNEKTPEIPAPKENEFYIRKIVNNKPEWFPISQSQRITNPDEVEEVYVKKSDGNLYRLSNEDIRKIIIFEEDEQSYWDIENAVQENELDVSANEQTPIDVKFSSDGLRMYVAGMTSTPGYNMGIHEYVLSEPLNIATAVHNYWFGVAQILGFCISSNGSKLYYCNGSSIYEYNLTAGQLSTKVLVRTQSLYQTIPVNNTGIEISDDGTKMAIINTVNQVIRIFTLPTPYSTVNMLLSYSTFDLSSVGFVAQGFHIGDNGSKLFLSSSSSSPSRIYMFEELINWQTWDLTQFKYIEVGVGETAIHTTTSQDGTKLFYTEYAYPSTIKTLNLSPTTKVAQEGNVRTGINGKPFVEIASLEAVRIAGLIKTEDLIGDINASNKIFTTSQNFISGSTTIFLNGIKQEIGTDYTETDDNQITMVEAPSNVGFIDKLTIQYNIKF